MNLDLKILKEKLCSLMCAEVYLDPVSEGLISVNTPFYFSDGDPYQIYIKERPGGIIRLTDMGHTMLHLSYENDTDKLREGTRGILLNQIISETSIEEDNGEFYIDTQIELLGNSIFRLGQALTKITDLSFLNRARAESTFYEDLKEQLMKIAGDDNIISEYYYSEMDNYKDYPIDFKIQGKNSPIFIFGIPNKDKARLTTIVLERLWRAEANFESILIFADQASIPRQDLARLSNVGGEMIASLDAENDFSRKLLKKISLN